MAKPNISLLGATYNGVAGVTLPKSGGGTATFPFVEGEEYIDENGEYDVTNLASIIVDVEGGGGGGGLTFESDIWTPSTDIARPTISFYNSHTEAPALIHLCDVTGTAHSTTNSNYVFTYVDPFKLWGYGYPYSSSGFRYAAAYYSYRASNTNSISSAGLLITNKSSSSTSSSTDYPRYWATESGFHPYSNSSSRYWRSGRTFKWIAVWPPSK